MKENPLNKKSMLGAFIEQSDIDPSSIFQSSLAEEVFGDGKSNPGTLEKSKDRKAQMQVMSKMKQKNTSVRKSLPEDYTRLKNNQLNETPSPHPNFKDYDHSLEKNRWRGDSSDGDIEINIL